MTTNQIIHPHFDSVDKAISLPIQGGLIWFGFGADLVFGIMDSALLDHLDRF